MSAYGDEAEIEGSRAPLIEHLVELRSRLIVCVAALILGFLACFFFAEPLYKLLTRPYYIANALMMEAHTGKRGPLDLIGAMLGLIQVPLGKPPAFVYTGPLEFFFTKMKLAGFGAVVITFPVLATQLYRFVAPGLYRRERKAFLPFLVAAPVLFFMGAALVYYVMLPFVLLFSLSQQIATPEVQITLLPKVSDYFDLVTKLLLAFGLCFQLPVVLSLVGLAGLVTAEQLSKYRRWAILGIVVVTALVTPPDPLSQCLLAIPIYGLYEISILCVRLMERRRKRDEAREAVAS